RPLRSVRGARQERGAEPRQRLALAEAATRGAGGGDRLELDHAYMLSGLYLQERRWPELEGAARRAVALAEKLYPGRDPEGMAAKSLSNLAVALGRLGRDDEALATFARILAVIGPDEPIAVVVQLRRARRLVANDRFREARVGATRALANARAIDGPEHPFTLAALERAARPLCYLGRPADARPLLEELLAKGERRTDVPGQDV